MRIGVLLLLVALPLIEIGVLVKVGGWIGFWPTLAVVLLTAALGIAVLMEHGVNAALRVQRSMLEGEAPLLPMLEGALSFAAGVLLITPGLIADALGLMLLVPPLRRWAARAAGRWLLLLDPATVQPEAAGARHDDQGPREPRSEPRQPDNGGAGPVIEGEFTRLGERTIDPENRRPDER